jgi:hypothetical protein
MTSDHETQRESQSEAQPSIFLTPPILSDEDIERLKASFFNACRTGRTTILSDTIFSDDDEFGEGTELLVDKKSAVVCISDELLADITGTSPVSHAAGGITSTSWKRRFRWWLSGRRYALAVWLFEHVSGDSLPGREGW